MSVVGEISAFFSIITFAGDSIKLVLKACEIIRLYKSVDKRAAALLYELQGVVKELSRVQYLGSRASTSGVSQSIAAPLYESVAQCQVTIRDLERQLPTGENGALPRRRKLRLMTENGLFEGYRLRVIQDRLGLINALNTFNANLGLHSVETTVVKFGEMKSGMAKLDSKVDDSIQRLESQLTNIQGQIAKLAAVQTVQLDPGENSRSLAPSEYGKAEAKETGNEFVFRVIQHCIQAFMSKGKVVERVKLLSPAPESNSALSKTELQQHAWVLLSLRLMAWLLERKVPYAQVTWTRAMTATSALARHGRLNFLWQQRDSLAMLRLELQDHQGEHIHAMTFLQYRDWRQYLIDFMAEDKTMADLLLLVTRHWHKLPKARHRVGMFIVPKFSADDSMRPEEGPQTSRPSSKARHEVAPNSENATAKAIRIRLRCHPERNEHQQLQPREDTLRADSTAAVNHSSLLTTVSPKSPSISETATRSFVEIGGFKVNQQFLSLPLDTATQAIIALQKVETYASHDLPYVSIYEKCTHSFNLGLPTGTEGRFQVYFISGRFVEKTVLEVYLKELSGEVALKSFRANSLMHLLALSAELTDDDVNELVILTGKLRSYYFGFGGGGGGLGGGGGGGGDDGPDIVANYGS